MRNFVIFLISLFYTQKHIRWYIERVKTPEYQKRSRMYYKKYLLLALITVNQTYLLKTGIISRPVSIPSLGGQKPVTVTRPSTFPGPKGQTPSTSKPLNTRPSQSFANQGKRFFHSFQSEKEARRFCNTNVYRYNPASGKDFFQSFSKINPRYEGFVAMSNEIAPDILKQLNNKIPFSLFLNYSYDIPKASITSSTTLAKIGDKKQIQEILDKSAALKFPQLYPEGIKNVPSENYNKKEIIQNVLTKSINRIDAAKDDLISGRMPLHEFIFPFYLLEVLGGYAADEGNIENVATKLNLTQNTLSLRGNYAWNGIELSAEPWNEEELSERLNTTLNSLLQVKVPISGGWLLQTKKSLNDYNYNELSFLANDAVTLAKNMLTEMIFKKTAAQVYTIIKQKQASGVYDQNTLEFIFTLLKKITARYEEIFKKAKTYYTNTDVAFYKSQVDTKIIDYLEKTIEEKYLDPVLETYRKAMINGIKPQSMLTPEEELILQEYLKDFKRIIQEFNNQEAEFEARNPFGSPEQEKTQQEDRQSYRKKTEQSAIEERPQVSKQAYAALGVPDNAPAYKILNVNPNPTRDQLARAFIKAAHQWHPDKNKQSPHAHEAFILIKWAYQTLRPNAG